MADSTDLDGAEKPSATSQETTTNHKGAAHQQQHDHERTTDTSSLSEKGPSSPPSRHTRSRASSHATDDSDPLEPLEIALSATGTSAWSRPPEFEVSFDAPSDPLNAREWPLWYRMWAIAAVSYSTWVVVLYSTSYTAAIPGLMVAFDEPQQSVATLGVTTYLLGLAVGSLIVAPMSELFGRRPVYLLCLTVSTLLVLPCALATGLAEIVVVRFFGALFASVMVCNGAGTIADISTDDDRAMYMSLWSIAPLNGPVTGPLIGGFVYQYLGWRWDNWLVLILSGVAVLLMATVKESYAPAILKAKAARRRKEEDDERYWCEYDDAKRSTLELMRVNLSRPFVLSVTEPILWFFNIWISVIYGILYLCFVAYPIVFEDKRGWGPGTTGLSFLGIGIGTLIAIFMEPVWRRIINSHAKDPSTNRVPPEASASIMSLGAILTPIGQLIFSWTCLPTSIHYAIPIAFGIPFGMGNTLCFIYGTNYLAGAYGTFAASALAGNAVIRSMFGATLPLAGPSMYTKLTPQWAGTLLGLLEVVLIPIPIVFYKYGNRIRARSPVIKRMTEAQAHQDRKRAKFMEKLERQKRQQQQLQQQEDEKVEVVDASNSSVAYGEEVKGAGDAESKDLEKGV
ncbi:MFS general substrate transporter [Cryphonectria parasitica EP155]|uniref:MFS general substrate transporter n=1 Tax=Cryphonectria parasitica (strain ATCC 38755 / EP155) TaxID=660469 RepID=A0A9P5CLF9_CRYP1|nr:MFS general substrate transporter [Cryphonectria parasitica EP155]KAF3763023.1 MFS general substrate transporter [Cryphonectria parasitica EP155]